MQAGKLRSRIVIEQQGGQQDEFGGYPGTWVPVHQCWAAIDALTGREVYVAGAGFTGQLTHKVTLRYTETAIAAGMRVRYRSRTLLVQAPPTNVGERDRELQLLCLEQSA